MPAKPGERKLQILQTLASMLENPKGEKITTAALAARLDVSEAALYRHFASKAQMFEGLIDFIEQTLFGLVNKITTGERSGLKQAEAIVSMLLGFAKKNPGHDPRPDRRCAGQRG
jgi:TetR/AcrR family transcriptional regulator